MPVDSIQYISNTLRCTMAPRSPVLRVGAALPVPPSFLPMQLPDPKEALLLFSGRRNIR